MDFANLAILAIAVDTYWYQCRRSFMHFWELVIFD